MTEQEWRDLCNAQMRDGTPRYDAWATAAMGDHFRPKVATAACAWIERNCAHIKGSAKQEALILEPWQRAMAGLLFGWFRADGTRRYREAFWFLPRKNGKTTLAAAVLLLIMTCDEEPGAEIYSAAADREQAGLVYQQVAGMIRKNPRLERRYRLRESNKSVQLLSSSGKALPTTYKALSAEAGTKHGLNTHCLINDELHAQPNRELVDVLLTSTGSRAQPLVIHITTSDFERPGSICNEKHDYAGKVRDGIIKDHAFLPVIYEASVNDDWKDPATWRRANPNMGISVTEDYLRRECARAIESPAFENTFKRLHLNVRTEQDVRWMPMDRWDACAAEPLCEGPCYMGVDLSSTRDLTAIALYWPETGGCKWWFFLPELTVRERVERNKIPYDQWAREGHIHLTRGNVIDLEFVGAKIIDLCDEFEVIDIAFDPWNAQALWSQLESQNYSLVQFRQGYRSMSGPTKHLEMLVQAERIAHGGNPVARWNASNVVVDMDPAGNLKPNKAKAGEKIDGIVALIMAIGRAIAEAPPAPSIYEERGLLTIGMEDGD